MDEFHVNYIALGNEEALELVVCEELP